MKAVVVEQYDTIDNILLKDVALPDVAAGQVRVKVQAASIGFVDGLKVQGLYQTKDPLPFTPGTEFAGIVDAVGADVAALRRGTAVMGMARSGALAEYIVVPAAALTAVPDGVAPEVAAAFRANYLTALYALCERGSLHGGRNPAGVGRGRRHRHCRGAGRQADGRACYRRRLHRGESASSPPTTAPMRRSTTRKPTGATR